MNVVIFNCHVFFYYAFFFVNSVIRSVASSGCEQIRVAILFAKQFFTKKSHFFLKKWSEKIFFVHINYMEKLRQYVVQTFCRKVDLAAKWNKKKINQKSITKNAKGAQHGKYSLCRDGCS